MDGVFSVSVSAEDLKEIVSRVRVHRVVVGRTLRTRDGDHFVSLSAKVGSVDAENPEVTMGRPLTLDEAGILHILLSLKANLAVFQSAFASGSLSEPVFNEAVNAIKHNHAVFLQRAVNKVKNGGD